jgi:hypothetical protein
MKKLSDEIARINSKIFQQKGKIFAGLMINWPKIVGEQYSAQTYPRNIREIKENSKINKTLYIVVKNSSIGLELSCHKEVIIERAAMFFGFRAIDHIRIIPE